MVKLHGALISRGMLLEDLRFEREVGHSLPEPTVFGCEFLHLPRRWTEVRTHRARRCCGAYPACGPARHAAHTCSNPLGGLVDRLRCALQGALSRMRRTHHASKRETYYKAGRPQGCGALLRLTKESSGTVHDVLCGVGGVGAGFGRPGSCSVLRSGVGHGGFEDGIDGGFKW